MSRDSAQPFRVELYLGGGVVVPFTISEEWLLSHRDPGIRAMAKVGSRDALRRAASEVVERAVMRNREDPIHIEDSPALWIIPTGSVLAVKLTDPALEAGRSGFGFSPDRLGAPPEAPKP